MKEPKKPISMMSRVTLVKTLNVEDNSIINPNKKQPRTLTVKIPHGKSNDAFKLRSTRFISCNNVYLAKVPNAPATASSSNVRMLKV